MARKKWGKEPNDRGIYTTLRVFMKVFMRLPGVSRWHPWLREDKTDMRWLPINEDIELPGDAPMPLAVLDRIIDEASHRVIVDYCGCRRGYRCRDYPHDIGCLMMGDSALEITAFPWREVDPDEAKAHARRASEAGLIPVVGKARVDNFIFRVKDRKRLVTVCFCCECCCVTRFTRLVPPRYVELGISRLAEISVDADSCAGCGTCVDRCYVAGITLENGVAVIGEKCQSCGRCADSCPRDAITVRITDPDFVDNTVRRIRSYVKYD